MAEFYKIFDSAIQDDRLVLYTLMLFDPCLLSETTELIGPNLDRNDHYILLFLNCVFILSKT